MDAETLYEVLQDMHNFPERLVDRYVEERARCEVVMSARWYASFVMKDRRAGQAHLVVPLHALRKVLEYGTDVLIDTFAACGLDPKFASMIEEYRAHCDQAIILMRCTIQALACESCGTED